MTTEIIRIILSVMMGIVGGLGSGLLFNYNSYGDKMKMITIFILTGVSFFSLFYIILNI